MRLEDGLVHAAELSPEAAAALRPTAPLIFFNACHSGRLGFSLTRLGSWAARLVQLGCGGYVGSLWPVTDRAALAFAREVEATDVKPEVPTAITRSRRDLRTTQHRVLGCMLRTADRVHATMLPA